MLVSSAQGDLKRYKACIMRVEYPYSQGSKAECAPAGCMYFGVLLWVLVVMLGQTCGGVLGCEAVEH